MTKNQTRNKETKHNFLQKNLKKRKMEFILPIIFAIIPTAGSCYRVIDLLNIPEFFSSVSKFLSCNEKKNIRVEKRSKKIMNINNMLKISKFCVMRLSQKNK